MSKSRASSEEGRGSNEKVATLPRSPSLPAEKSIPLPEHLRWKVKAFQEGEEKAQANVKAAQAELHLRQVELQGARKELQLVVDEVTFALQSSVPPGYILAELNPTRGVALCRLAPAE